MKLFSTKTHGMLDYLTAGALFALPMIIKPSNTVSTVLRTTAIGVTIYSMLTRYELGVAPVLPMKTHLLLDGMSGALFAASPLLFAAEKPNVKALLAGIGAFELAASLLTEPAPRTMPQLHHAKPFA